VAKKKNNHGLHGFISYLVKRETYLVVGLESLVLFLESFLPYFLLLSILKWLCIFVRSVKIRKIGGGVGRR